MAALFTTSKTVYVESIQCMSKVCQLSRPVLLVLIIRTIVKN